MVDDPYHVYARRFDTVLTAKAMRQAEAISEAASAPTTMSALFLPNSRHFCSGFVTVDDLKMEKVNTMDAL
jgi:hypothetical protein